VASPAVVGRPPRRGQRAVSAMIDPVNIEALDRSDGSYHPTAAS
jgi:hypothetical protein